ncbi:hypothetical protein B7R21_18980 [Subtercola boreus]|uniref:Uncharacterized protein n=1 Tax=Subtercola boreus TaxID=120213 RepID=A0A3E0VA83_9MICO|nr:ABC-three component system middle component 2 [Subtercola boreus]RFA06684.1 hypothetical protein B7R21_18980 [Subtercola boreus]
MSNLPTTASDLNESVNPEELGVFRCARMLVLFAVAKRDGRRLASVDRLAFYDFFADSPWVVVSGERRIDIADARALKVAGFSQTQLSYASTGPRFASRRQRVQFDLAQLVAYGLVSSEGAEYEITELGQDREQRMYSSYADAYRVSAGIVLRRLSSLSLTRLQTSVEEWIGHSWLLLDLLDDVRGAELPIAIETTAQKDE